MIHQTPNVIEPKVYEEEEEEEEEDDDDDNMMSVI